VLLETEPLFLLEEHKSGELPYDARFRKMMNTLDFTELADKFPYPPGTIGKELYHIELLVNPHDFEPDNPDKGVYLRTIYKIPYVPGYEKRVRETKGFQYGDNTLGLVQSILDTLGNDGAGSGGQVTPATGGGGRNVGGGIDETCCPVK